MFNSQLYHQLSLVLQLHLTVTVILPSSHQSSPTPADIALAEWSNLYLPVNQSAYKEKNCHGISLLTTASSLLDDAHSDVDHARLTVVMSKRFWCLAGSSNQLFTGLRLENDSPRFAVGLCFGTAICVQSLQNVVMLRFLPCELMAWATNQVDVTNIDFSSNLSFLTDLISEHFQLSEHHLELDNWSHTVAIDSHGKCQFWKKN